MEQEQDMITENRQDFKACSGSQLATVAGFELCGELSFPNASQIADSPYFPFTGPSSASITLYKRDSHNGYKIFGKRVQVRSYIFTHLLYCIMIDFLYKR